MLSVSYFPVPWLNRDRKTSCPTWPEAATTSWFGSTRFAVRGNEPNPSRVPMWLGVRWWVDGLTWRQTHHFLYIFPTHLSPIVIEFAYLTKPDRGDRSIMASSLAYSKSFLGGETADGVSGLGFRQPSYLRRLSSAAVQISIRRRTSLPQRRLGELSSSSTCPPSLPTPRSFRLAVSVMEGKKRWSYFLDGRGAKVLVIEKTGRKILWDLSS